MADRDPASLKASNQARLEKLRKRGIEPEFADQWVARLLSRIAKAVLTDDEMAEWAAEWEGYVSSCLTPIEAKADQYEAEARKTKLLQH